MFYLTIIIDIIYYLCTNSHSQLINNTSKQYMQPSWQTGSLRTSSLGDSCLSVHPTGHSLLLISLVCLQFFFFSYSSASPSNVMLAGFSSSIVSLYALSLLKMTVDLSAFYLASLIHSVIFYCSTWTWKPPLWCCIISIPKQCLCVGMRCICLYFKLYYLSPLLLIPALGLSWAVVSHSLNE